MFEKKNESIKSLLWSLPVAAMLVLTYPALGQQRAASPAFKDYDVIQYVRSTEIGPANILQLDNNGDIVLAVRGGATRAQLAAQGVSFSESQIALLKTFRLIDEKDDTLRTLIPVLGQDKTRVLRERARSIALPLARRLKPKIRELREELARTGQEKHAYSIIFSYVLDGLVWDEFEKNQILRPRRITAETPLWAGQVWALFPRRPFYAGTNSMSDQGVSLKVTWAEEAIPQMLPFVADIATLARLFDDYQRIGLVKDGRAREVFGPFGLFDDSGHFTIPVIDERQSNRLYRSARGIAAGAAKEVPALLNLADLVREFGFQDKEQALVVAYHELLWDVMDQLEALALVEKPVAFATPKQARPADIAALVFIVKGTQ